MGVDDDSVFDIYQEDARNLKEKLDSIFDSTDGLIDAIITSPPYADIQDYGQQEDQVGEQPYEDFLSDLREIFRQCYNIASDEATLWIITDSFRENNRVIRPPFDLAEDLENLENRKYCTHEDCTGRLDRDRGTGILICDVCDETVNPLTESWRLTDHIIWNKQRTRPWQQKGKLRNIYEHVSMYTKTDKFKYNQDEVRIEDIDEFGRWWVDYPERYHPKGKLPDNVWEFPIPKQGEWGPKLNYHPSPFPEGLVERIIRLSTDPGDVILDPFAGVGSTLAVAERLDRKPIGFEINEEFIDHYHNHVLPKVGKKATKQQKLVDEEKGHSLEYAIWTLRIHKYALKLQRELITKNDFDFSRKDFNSIFVNAHPETFTADVAPSASLYYIGTNRLTELSDQFAKAREALVSDNRGSGDYYEVDFTLEQYTVDNWFETTVQDLVDEDDALYIYTEGIHYWFRDDITIGEWHDLQISSQWKRYQSTSWSPLVSTLPIQIENPIESVEPSMDEDQAILDSFLDSTDDT